MIHHDVNIPIIIKVSKRRSPAHMASLEIRAYIASCNPELTLPALSCTHSCVFNDIIFTGHWNIGPNEWQLFVWNSGTITIHVTVGHKTVRPGVVIEIHQSTAPAHHWHAVCRQSYEGCNVVKPVVIHILIQSVIFVCKIGHKEVDIAIAVKIFSIQAHT